MNRLKQRKILVVDDEKDMRWVLTTLFEGEGFKVFSAGDGKEALNILKKNRPHVMVSDIRMPKMDGMELLHHIREIDLTVPVIMMTAYSEVGTAVEAMKTGAYDYIVKPFDNEELILTVNRALKGRALEDEVARLKILLGEKKDVSRVMGKSTIIQDLSSKIKRVAGSDFSVLIEGESGTGKELVAEAIHLNSKREDRPFIIVDCGAIPETLIESELFGYERGAFTGAHKRKNGLFEAADRGTLFLDEIGNLPMSMQPKLLRAIESKSVTHLGGTKRIPVDIRIVSATNKKLTQAVQKGDFREDLFFRLNEFSIGVPPLRDRKDDILYLAHMFLKDVNRELNKLVDGFSKRVEKGLLLYSWPGNVRELKNIIRRTALLADRKITDAHIPQEMMNLESHSAQLHDLGGLISNGLSWKEIKKRHQVDFEKRVLTEVLEKTDGNKRQAARILQMDYKTLHSKVKELNIQISP